MSQLDEKLRGDKDIVTTLWAGFPATNSRKLRINTLGIEKISCPSAAAKMHLQPINDLCSRLPAYLHCAYFSPGLHAEPRILEQISCCAFVIPRLINCPPCNFDKP